MKNTSSSHKAPKNPHSSRERSRIGGLIISVATGTGVGLICFFLLILIFSGLCLALENPHSLTFALSLAAIYLSALAAGFSSVRKNHKCDALLCGALTGLTFMLALCALLLLIPTGAESAPSSAFVLRILVLPLSIAGSFLGRAQKKVKRHKKF